MEGRMFIVMCFFLGFVFSVDNRATNIVVILADDLGWGDVGCFGSATISTPNIDRLANEGLKIPQFYTANAICTPSRAAILTGRLPVRSGMYGNWNDSTTNVMTQVLHGDGVGQLPANETTIARILSANKYRTKIVGKWHLGILPHQWPTNFGFDEFFGTPMMHGPNEGNQTEFPDMQLIDNDRVVGRLYRDIDIYTLHQRYLQNAIQFIEEQTSQKQPFFLYFAPDNTHIPLYAAPAFQNTSRRGLYGDTVQELDYIVGEIVNVIRKLGIAENTFLFFTSDNGPDKRQNLCNSLPGQQCDPTQGGSSGPFRGGKSTTWEGGIRVPAIAWWPGTIPANQVTFELGATTDLFATILAICNLTLPKDRIIDGKNLLPLFLQKTKTGPHEFLFHWRGQKLMAVRHRAYKAHFYTEGEYEWNDPGLKQMNPVLLFQVEHDPSERFPLDANSNIYKQQLKMIEEGVKNHLANMTFGAPQMNVCDKHVALWKPDLPVPPSKPYLCCQDPCSSW